MTLRKKTIDNSVKNVPQSEQTGERERDGKPNTITISSSPRQQKKTFSQNKRTFSKNIAAEGFCILK